MSDTQTAVQAPTVYFIDDSATMREVIKMAFRKENIQIIACPDAASALAQFEQAAPDAVITDVIMPDKDGYEVCQFIRKHERFAKIPVILMSGVVDRSVAERATEVKADELIRKPFQPLDLLSRVKTLLRPKGALVTSVVRPDEIPAENANVAPALADLFSSPKVAAPAYPRPNAIPNSTPTPSAANAPAVPSVNNGPEAQKLKQEIWRLELLVKKLQAELQAQDQYCAALEAHFKTTQNSA